MWNLTNFLTRLDVHIGGQENISHTVWLYHRFCLRLRDVEELLAERGIFVTYESIRQWCNHFGPECSRAFKKGSGRLGDNWYLHEPTRQRERQMRRFKTAGQAKRFLTIHGAVGNLFRLGRHVIRATHYREFRSEAFSKWRQVTCE